MNTRKHISARHTGLALLIMSATLAGCATTTAPVVVGTTQDPTFQRLAKAQETIFLMRPHVTFEDADTERPLFGASDRVNSVMMAIASEELTLAGFQISRREHLASEKQRRAGHTVDALNAECRVLTSSYKDKSALIPMLNELADLTGARIACVQTVRVKVGAGSSWDPNSGAVAQGTSSTEIRVAFISLRNGDVLWKNASMLRYTPKNKKFNKAVKMAYSL